MKSAKQKEQKLDTWHKNSLALFPTDVLNIMTGYLNGFATLALYTCGSGLLNYKLRKNGAVTHFRVRGGVDVFPPHRDWRNHNFKSLCLFGALRTLELVGFSGYAFRYFGTPIIAGLPQTLEKIRFDFIESFTMWVDVQKSPVPIGTDLSFVPFYLDEHFPRLTSLDLRSSYWDRLTIYRGKECTAYNWQPHLREEFLAHIPRSVTYLSLVSISGVTAKFGAGLPEDLSALRLQVTQGYDAQDDNFISSLPRNLVDLDLGETVSMHCDGLKDLPPRLARLVLGSVNMDHVVARRGIARVEHSNDYVPSFPAELASLTVTRGASWITPAALKIGALPANLTVLCLTDCNQGIDNDCVQYFPRTLTVLHLSPSLVETTSINEQALMDLPSSLVSLNLASSVELPWSCLELLPRQLKLFAHHTFIYASTPDEANAPEDVATRYWKLQGPPGCQYRFTNWNGLPEDIRNHRAQLAQARAQHLQQFPPGINQQAPHPDSDTDTDTDGSDDEE